MTYVLAKAVYSATDSLKAGARVEVAMGRVGHEEYVDVYTPTITVRQVSVRKLKRAEAAQ